MHKDIIDSYRLKKRKELEQSLPCIAAVGVDMVNTSLMQQWYSWLKLWPRNLSYSLHRWHHCWNFLTIIVRLTLMQYLCLATWCWSGFFGLLLNFAEITVKHLLLPLQTRIVYQFVHSCVCLQVCTSHWWFLINFWAWNYQTLCLLLLSFTLVTYVP